MLLLLNSYMSFVVLTSFLFGLSSVWTQTLPEVACPQYFEYIFERGRYYGRFTLPMLKDNFTKLDVQLSQPTRIVDGYFGNITVEQRQSDLRHGQAVVYIIHFPTPTDIPKLDRLTINDVDICLSKDYEFLPNNVQTLYLQHNLSYFLTHSPPPLNVRPTATYPVITNNGPSRTNAQYGSIPFPATSRQPPTRSTANVQFITVPSSVLPATRPQTDFRNLPTVPSNTQFVPIEPHIISNDERGDQRSSSFLNFASPPQTQPQLIPMPIPNRSRQSATPTSSSPALQRTELSETCGQQITEFTPFIYGGRNLTRGQFPWLTPIYRKELGSLQFLCSGTLISTRTIITAGHCISNIFELTYDQILAYVGRYNLQDYGETGARPHELTRFVLHPEYNATTISDADVALLLLRESVTYTEYIQPVCLWRESDDSALIEKELAYIAGWGTDELRRPITNLPKMVTSRIYPLAECRRARAYSKIVTQRTICAGNSDGSGPCQGDSGGGLLISRNGRWVLRGILSGGATIAQLCELNKLVIYCDIAKHMDWILQNMIP